MNGDMVINDTDDFRSSDFPLVVKELAEIKERVKPWHYASNEIVVLSYVKDHMIRADLARSHPGVVEILTSKNTCCHLEDLFVLCKENERFRLSLENYVIDQIKIK
jgi:UDP-glucose 6-dehydrogenase